MKLTTIGITIMFFTLPAWAGTLLIDFDKGNLGGWQERLMVGVPPGSWEIINRELHAVSDGQSTRLLTVGDETWSDYTVEFDVKPLKKRDRSRIAIAARIKGDWAVWCVIGDFPSFPENPFRVMCLAGRFRGPRPISSFGSKPHPPLILKEWSQLKLEVEGNILNLWINGKHSLGPVTLPSIQTFQQRDAHNKQVFVEEHGGDPKHFEVVNLDGFQDFLTGGAGLGLSNQEARFDNFVITGESIPDRHGLSVKPKAKLATLWGYLKRP